MPRKPGSYLGVENGPEEDFGRENPCLEAVVSTETDLVGMPIDLEKPCPFCGDVCADVTETELPILDGSGLKKAIYCNTCFAEGPPRDTKEEAITAWAYRATEVRAMSAENQPAGVSGGEPNVEYRLLEFEADFGWITWFVTRDPDCEIIRDFIADFEQRRKGWKLLKIETIEVRSSDDVK